MWLTGLMLELFSQDARDDTIISQRINNFKARFKQ